MAVKQHLNKKDIDMHIHANMEDRNPMMPKTCAGSERNSLPEETAPKLVI